MTPVSMPSPKAKLEVFRCAERKGWGVRALHKINQGKVSEPCVSPYQVPI